MFIRWLESRSHASSELYVRTDTNGSKELIIENITAEVMIAFLAWKKYANADCRNPSQLGAGDAAECGGRELLTHDTVRKFVDAVYYVSVTTRTPLPVSRGRDFKTAVRQDFLDHYKKEVTRAKAQGLVKDNSASTMPFAMFSWLAEQAMLSGNVKMWLWLLLQWHCMCRSDNIRHLRLQHIVLEEDSIQVTFPHTKTKQKHCYSNPFIPFLDLNLAMACYLAVSSMRKCDTLFPGGHAASQAFNKWLSAMLDSPAGLEQRRRCGCDGKNITTHSLRKSSATYSASGSTDGPLGHILDLYIRWAAAGDQYLGRVLAGLRLSDPQEFQALPFHFVDSLLSDENGLEIILKATETVFTGSSKHSHLQVCRSFRPVLTRCLAALVGHHDWIQRTVGISHATFQNIKLFQTSFAPILQQLKVMATRDCNNVHRQLTPTGIPGLVTVQNKINGLENSVNDVKSGLQQVHQSCEYIKSQLDNLTQHMVMTVQRTVESAVAQSIEKVALQNGHMSAQSMKDLLSQQQKSMRDNMEAALSKMHDLLEERLEREDGVASAASAADVQASPAPPPDDPGEQSFPLTYSQFSGPANGTVDLPHDHDLGTGRHSLPHAWKLWLEGPEPITVNGRLRYIKPYRMIAGAGRTFAGRVSQQQKLQLRDVWRPFFRLCESGLDSELLPVPASLVYDPAYIMQTLDQVLNVLKQRFSFIFAADEREDAGASSSSSDSDSALVRRKMKWESWSVSTWARNTKPSVVLQAGVASDIRHLSQAAVNSEGQHKKRRRVP